MTMNQIGWTPAPRISSDPALLCRRCLHHADAHHNLVSCSVRGRLVATLPVHRLDQIRPGRSADARTTRQLTATSRSIRDARQARPGKRPAGPAGLAPGRAAGKRPGGAAS
jgi:hypothetical protein